MPKYPVTWVDYRLPTGKEFAVAVCGYSRKIRHMYLGTDIIRRQFINHVNVEGKHCNASRHCLDLGCPLNRTPREHLLHMLDMNEDETLDAKTSELWGTESTIEGLVKFAKKMNQSLPKELQQEVKAE